VHFYTNINWDVYQVYFIQRATANQLFNHKSRLWVFLNPLFSLSSRFRVSSKHFLHQVWFRWKERKLISTTSTIYFSSHCLLPLFFHLHGKKNDKNKSQYADLSYYIATPSIPPSQLRLFFCLCFKISSIFFSLLRSRFVFLFVSTLPYP
jgi:hypothetical protein